MSRADGKSVPQRARGHINFTRKCVQKARIEKGARLTRAESRAAQAQATQTWRVETKDLKKEWAYSALTTAQARAQPASAPHDA